MNELSRLRFAAQSVNVGFEELSGGMQALSDSIEEAAGNAGSEVARAFAAMGVSVRDASGETRDLMEVFDDVSDRFSRYEDDARTAALASALFGDQAEEMTRVASLTAAEMDRLSDASDRTGNTITRQAAQAMEVLAQAGRDSASALSGLATELVNRVAPTLLTLIDYFRQAYDNSSLLKLGIEILAGAFRVLTDALISADGVLREIGNLITGVFNAVKALLSGDLAAAGAALSEMWSNVGKAWNEATAAITALHTGITSLWQTTVQFEGGTNLAPRFLSTAEAARAAAAAMRSFREEMANIVADPMTTYGEKLAAIQVAEQEGAITTEQAEKQRRRAYEMTARMAESSFQSIGRALSALFPKSKAAAISEALINTYVGITQALRSGPPPWNFIQAAAVGAMGFAQVRSITSTSEGGGGGAASAPSPSGDAGGGVPSQMITVDGLTPDSIVSGASMRGLIERLNAAVRDGATIVFQ